RSPGSRRVSSHLCSDRAWRRRASTGEGCTVGGRDPRPALHAVLCCEGCAVPFRRFASRVPRGSCVSNHLSHFALWTALPSSLVGRHAHDYYWDSVALGLAPRRPSHGPSPRNVSSAP